MSDSGNGFGQRIYDAIQGAENDGLVFCDEHAPEHAVLRSYVVVSEWITGGGERWLTMATWDMSGTPPPAWETLGLLEHEAAMLRGLSSQRANGDE